MKSFFFRNVRVYRLVSAFKGEVDTLNKSLEQHNFTPCGAHDMARAGWDPVCGDSLIYVQDDWLFVRMKREEKILPATVVNAEVQRRVNELEQKQARKLRKTERDTVKDEALHALLPRAFTKTSTSGLVIDRKKSLIYVEASSARRAEDILGLLRKSLGSLPVIPFTAKTPPELTFTSWLRDGVPAPFSAGEEAVLMAALEHGGAIRCKDQDLQSDEVIGHLDAGKLVTTVALSWDQRATFRLDDELALKGVRFSDELVMQNDDIDREDVQARFDADFLLFTAELDALFSALIDVTGGELER